jgi:hypothetical protein
LRRETKEWSTTSWTPSMGWLQHSEICMDMWHGFFCAYLKNAFCSLKRLAFDTFHLPARLFLAGCGVHWPCGERCNTLCCSSPASLNHRVQYILW